MTETVWSDWADAGRNHRTQQAIRRWVVAPRRSAIASARAADAGLVARTVRRITSRATRSRNGPHVACNEGRAVRDRARLNAITGLNPHVHLVVQQTGRPRRDVTQTIPVRYTSPKFSSMEEPEACAGTRS